jgi:hypothetical protein
MVSCWEQRRRASVVKSREEYGELLLELDMPSDACILLAVVACLVASELPNSCKALELLICKRPRLKTLFI